MDDNLFEWELLVVGPADTLYEVCARCVVSVCSVCVCVCINAPD